MATEQGGSGALGLQFQSMTEEEAPLMMGNEEPHLVGFNLVQSSEASCKTHHGDNQVEHEGQLRCNGNHPGRSPVPDSTWGDPQLLMSAPWDNGVMATLSSERLVCPNRELGYSGVAEPVYHCLDLKESNAGGQRNAAAMEVQRLNFRHFCYQETKRPGEICSQLWYLCHRWLKPERLSKEQILELLILEQFLDILPSKMQVSVKRNHPQSCAQAVTLVEDFLRKEREKEKWKNQVVYEETPENCLEMKHILSEDGQKEPDMEVEQEVKGVANCIGRCHSIEKEPPPLKIVDLTEICGPEEGGHPLSIVEKEEERLLSPVGSEGNLGKDREDGIANCTISDPLGEPMKPPTALKGKQETICSVCGKSFSRRTGLLAHERVHTGEKPYKCAHCGRSFRSKSTLVVHQRTHTGEKPYQCRECGKSFPVTTQLIEHKRTHSGEKPYQCVECGQTFRQRSHLKNHQKIHTGLKPFTCSYCGKGFSISSDLIRHERAHTGEKPFQCPDCGKRFCNSSQVITHRRVHMGEKPYKCLECGKGFTVSQQLIRHQTVHTGEKPYQCLECGKTFSVSTLLAGHLRIHTGEKPYECSECGKCFRLRSTLITHLKTHTGQTT